MTSRDVIHSFYVPALPHEAGRPARALLRRSGSRRPTPGTYPIFCAEYCGVAPLEDARHGAGALGRPTTQSWLEPASDRRERAHRPAPPTGASVAARARVPGVPHRRRAAAHRADLGGALRIVRHARTTGARVARRRGVPHAIDDGAERRRRRWLQAGHARRTAACSPQPEVAALVEFIKSLRDVRARTASQLPTLSITRSRSRRRRPRHGAAALAGGTMTTAVVVPGPRGRGARAYLRERRAHGEVVAPDDRPQAHRRALPRLRHRLALFLGGVFAHASSASSTSRRGRRSWTRRPTTACSRSTASSWSGSS